MNYIPNSLFMEGKAKLKDDELVWNDHCHFLSYNDLVNLHFEICGWSAQKKYFETDFEAVALEIWKRLLLTKDSILN